MIGLGFVYVLMGALLAGVAAVNATDREAPGRWGNAAFWGLWALEFLAGGRISPLANGVLVVALVLVAAARGVRPAGGRTTGPAERAALARRWGNRLFLPALVVPAVTLAGTLALPLLRLRGAPLVDPRQVTLVALGVATLAGLGSAVALLRPAPLSPLTEARRLMDAVGWAAVLPQLLAALGAVFAAAGVGRVVGALAARWVPLDPLFVVVAYCAGMALFTALMGNAFAAFPVMTAAVGLPLIVHRFGGDPAVMAAIGMLSGFCGTLMTPMAANFNVVPAALLELRDPHAVIRAQLPTAFALLACNVALMYVLVYHH